MNIPENMLAIADDLTGAAEIASVGGEFGLPARVIRAAADLRARGLTVLDTDSRSLSPTHAAEKVAALLRNIPLQAVSLLYKKTDSLLRGNIAAEMTALMAVSGHPQALLLPQNPSKGRTIERGCYFIDGIPLDETPFKDDPEHPRFSADIAQLVPRPSNLVIANAKTLADVSDVANTLPTNTLAAGGSDFFRALLTRHLGAPNPVRQFNIARPEIRLIIAGSASDYSRQTIRTWQSQNLPVFPLSAATSTDEILSHLRAHRLAILAITDPLDATRAATFRNTLATAAANVLTALGQSLVHLYIEGGATASAIVDLLRWQHFDFITAPAAGVVSLSPAAAPHILLTIKPGSYPWPAGAIQFW